MPLACRTQGRLLTLHCKPDVVAQWPDLMPSLQGPLFGVGWRYTPSACNSSVRSQDTITSACSPTVNSQYIPGVAGVRSLLQRALPPTLSGHGRLTPAPPSIDSDHTKEWSLGTSVPKHIPHLGDRFACLTVRRKGADDDWCRILIFTFYEARTNRLSMLSIRRPGYNCLHRLIAHQKSS
ncbi:hypothetical protein BDU57DRAFT_524255 [Ampelomyces quisqualis]|uniref:Uncharacterized protein n=1 Tax=Ampelomyces quisqualis TaxID=50730 RepID=A0A6A5Q8G6_AMPQU|nr:hypothetical protein BDU57DRAFT_524255 [Ampelomyces quisqualis]